MKSYIYDINDDVSIVRTDCAHIGARYAVILREQLTETLVHWTPKGEYDSFEEAIEEADELITKNELQNA